MMLVEHQPVESHLFGVELFVQVPVVKLGAQVGVVNIVANGQVHYGLARGPEITGRGVLVGSFRKVSDVHYSYPLRMSGQRHPSSK